MKYFFGILCVSFLVNACVADVDKKADARWNVLQKAIAESQNK